MKDLIQMIIINTVYFVVFYLRMPRNVLKNNSLSFSPQRCVTRLYLIFSASTAGDKRRSDFLTNKCKCVLCGGV